ncbi:hypothetical protein GTW37_39165, partial [Streptomyces sp. SID4931]|nr:hypothetical protein [Streptomyces sp. SID4931]
MVTRQLNKSNKQVAQQDSSSSRSIKEAGRSNAAGPEDVVSDTQTLIDNRPPSVASLFIDRVAATPDG